jgi:hypothetical protein
MAAVAAPISGGERLSLPQNGGTPTNRSHRSRSQGLRALAATNPSPKNRPVGAADALDIFIRRVDNTAHLRREGEEGDDVLPDVAPGFADHRVALAPVGFEALERFRGGVGVDGGVDRLQVVSDGAPVFVGHEAE